MQLLHAEGVLHGNGAHQIDALVAVDEDDEQQRWAAAGGGIRALRSFLL
jgi:hypothetical protein